MDIRKIKKRDGRIEDFDRSKIENAVAKAFRASGEVDAEHVGGVSEAIVILLLSGMRGSSAAAVDTMPTESTDVGGEESIPTVEEIQDRVEAALMKSGYPETAKAYILYRSQHGKARQAKKTLLDYKKLIEGYTGANKDWRVKENSTVTLCVGGLILSNSGAVTANYWLSEVYDEDIAQAHRQCYLHLHDLSMLTPYCAGWSLKQLIQEGLGGVPGKISSAPAKHLSTLCNQMVNFLGILQNEWAGAQAFSSFDTYLAPFVRADNLTYQEVKQCIQSFIYGVNTPSRWGCVPPSTEILTEEGWKHYNDLKKGEGIYTWKNGALELCPLKEVVVKEHNGVLHQYRARGYNQTVTPDHRVLCKKHNLGQYVIRRSEDIFGVKTPYYLPVRFHGSSIAAREKGITEAEAAFAAIVYTDGSIDMRGGSVHKVCIYKSPNREGNEEIEELSSILGFKFTRKELTGGFGSPVNKYSFYGDSARAIVELVGTTKKSIHPKFTGMSADCSEAFLATWSRYDGRDEKFMLQYDNDDIADALQHIALRAGYTSFKYHSGKADYVKIRKTENVQPAARTEIPYEGIVWCPNDDNGTAVFRSADGEVFISGQCQAPFTNVTLDWTCPPDMKDLPAIVGGKEMDFTYGDCKEEMDMVNRAFIEIMLEGDANGRGFQYPIPTYSITKDFDWSDTENNRLLFEMTAKYGTPYYSNYVSSDMKPSDVRAMCPLHGKEKVLVRDDYSREFHISTIESLYKACERPGKTYEVILNGETKRARIHRYDNQKFYRIRTVNGHEVVLSASHANLVLGNDIKRTDELTAGDYLPFNVVPFDGSGLSYDDGLMVGAFMGDGSLKDKYGVTFSLNRTSKAGLMADIIKLAEVRYGGKVAISDLKCHCVNVTVYSRMLRGLIEEYVSGKALSKGLNPKCIGKSLAFREGILDGYRRTDGGTKNRIYSASKKAVESMAAMLMSMGIPSRISMDDRDGSTTLSDNPIYSIRPYNVDNGQKSYGDVYVKEDGYMWFRIQSISEVENGSHIGYCFEVIDDSEPYFTLPCGLVTHNCRLRLDLRELRKKGGGFFGSGESTGSVGVVTLNLPRLAYLSGSEEDFYVMLDHYMDLAARSLKIKRRTITGLMEGGLYPYTKRYLGTFENHFSTIGIVGMNEAIENAIWLDGDITGKEGHQFALDVLNHMRDRLSDYQEQYGDLYNLEATPAESTTYRFAKHDVEEFPDIITAEKNGGAPFYTNSTHLPVGFTDDIFDALELEDDLQVLYTSGTVFHGFLGQELRDWKAARDLVRKIAENFRLPYYTLTPTYSVCAIHGYIPGKHFACPECGREAEVYSRITGYYRPLRNWNDGKISEFRERVTYAEDRLDGPVTGTVKGGEQAKDAETTGGHETAIEPAILVATRTCPNCKAAKKMLDRAGISYRVIFADTDPGMMYADSLGIMQAPALVVEDGAAPNGETRVYEGIGMIAGYIKGQPPRVSE